MKKDHLVYWSLGCSAVLLIALVASFIQMSRLESRVANTEAEIDRHTVEIKETAKVSSNAFAELAKYIRSR